ncbi:carboxypeptidase-like regulatory domain-containing protein [Myxococcus stipitatus]|uniref:carboxypeptidase-like regulatory domain-containing protein n=1 Tax=Myxococcus stipitatus TaxID=83455 RepID=UPI001F453695|nr:carboxypeptidase-like regulatory domain-containing protein [Myxococcus stipitatus]MCE9670937.1 carboxypeptidase-like regulatory domain-containing protein [Myxococcus stipitatus]
MSLRRALLTAALAASSLLSACALRPTYQQVVQSPGVESLSPGQTVVLRVVDAAGAPVAGARILAGEGRTRLSATSDADGIVKLEVSGTLLKENPLVEVITPKGVSGYRLLPVPSGDAPAETAPEAPVTPEAPATPETSPSAPQTPAAPDAPAAATTPAPAT